MQAFSILKLLFTLVIVYLTYQLIFSEQHWIIFDNANLAIHEGGHLIFTPFGRFLYVLGGSLTQIMIPVAFTCYFFYTRQFFSSAFCLWWVGNNFVNVGRYISDARAQVLPLLGGEGVIHDWNYLLSQTHMLSWDTSIGMIMFGLGILICLVGIVAMGIFSVLNNKA